MPPVSATYRGPPSGVHVMDTRGPPSGVHVMDTDDPRTSRRRGLDSLRSARGGPLGGRPWKRRCRGSRGKPNPGFPPLPPPLGNRPWRFPLSHRLDDDFPSLSQSKGEEGSMTQSGHIVCYQKRTDSKATDRLAFAEASFRGSYRFQRIG